MQVNRVRQLCLHIQAYLERDQDLILIYDKSSYYQTKESNNIFVRKHKFELCNRSRTIK